jgi:DNA-directed RNA polymerase specialized sigma24 family protein
MTEPHPKADEVLLPLLQNLDEAESDHLILQIISEHAEPIIREIIKYKLRIPSSLDSNGNIADADDIYNDVMVELLRRLDAFRADPQRNAIGQLRSYVAVITYHACYRHLRRVYPRRHLLKNRLRYLLTHQAGFALWEGEHKETLCGFAAWRIASKRPAAGDKLKQLDNDQSVLAETGLLTADAASSTPADLLAAIFAYAGGPLELDEVVNAVASLWNLQDRQLLPETDEGTAKLSTEPGVDVAEAVDRRQYLSKLWAEIGQLPLQQRMALLLNLRGAEGRGCIELFQLAGVATVEEMAAGLEMTVEQLAAIWNELPLDDLKVAERLGLTRQQVINLRKSARARLSRRMKSFG